MKNVYRTNAREPETEGPYVPKWKYVLMSAGWGAVGVAIGALSILVAWLGPPSCETECSDQLIDVEAVTSGFHCEDRAQYRGVVQAGDKRLHFCQCPNEREPDASFAVRVP